MGGLIFALALAATRSPPLPPSPLPEIRTSDLHFFPVCERYTSQVVERLDAHRRSLARIRKDDCPESWHESWFDAVDRELTERRQPWFCLLQAQRCRARGDVESCLEWLGLLRQTLGDNYYSGSLPEPLPLWAYVPR